MVDKQDKEAVVVPTLTQKEDNNLEKYQVLKEELEMMWGLKALAVPVEKGNPRL